MSPARGGLLLVLLAVFVAQWAAPASLLLRGARIESEGQRYYFRTAPVDPVDAFRGRYVILNFDVARVPMPQAQTLRRGERVYAPLRVGKDRFAWLGTPQRERPDGPHLEVRVQHYEGQQLWLQLPFDRYYLDEHLAPRAERAVADASRRRDRTPSRAYVAVKVHHGDAVLEELFIDDEPVHRYLARQQASEP